MTIEQFIIVGSRFRRAINDIIRIRRQYLNAINRDKFRHRSVRNIVKEGMAGAQRVRRQQSSVGFNQTMQGNNLDFSAIAQYQVSVTVGCQQRHVGNIRIRQLDTEVLQRMRLHFAPGRNPMSTVQQLARRLRLTVNKSVFPQEYLMRWMRGIGLVLVNPRRGGIDRIQRCVDFRPGEDHEICRARGRAIERVIGHQRDKHDPISGFRNQIQTMVKELPKEGHPAVKGRR